MYYQKLISTSSCSIAFWAKVRLSRQCVAILGFVSRWRIWLVTLRDDLARPDRTQIMASSLAGSRSYLNQYFSNNAFDKCIRELES